MNTMPLPTFLPTLRLISMPPSIPAARPYGERDFGTGYGRSSGYAAPRRYVSGWNGQPRFRCG
ncbi:MAG TPA: hypothetical protein VKM00_04160 [Luteimonas sp.]|nr:hypothetical protein [Luteimonas sp.]